MPPSVPPARVRATAGRRASRSSQRISSWASLPRRAAVSNPSPSSTPFMAWMLISACASSPSMRAVPVDVRAEPGAAPRSRGPRPPRRANRRPSAAASTSATIAASASGSKQRTADASTVSRSAGLGRRSAAGADRAERPRRGSAPGCRGGRAAPWPARRRRRAPRSPGRWPARARRGRRRTRTSACRRGRRGRGGAGAAAVAVRPGAGDISSLHFGHSVLWISIATGEPSVRPWRTPAEELDVVPLEAHAGPAPEPEPAAGQLGRDVVDRDRQPGRQALDDHDEGRAVGLPRGQEAQHTSLLRMDARVGASQRAIRSGYRRARGPAGTVQPSSRPSGATSRTSSAPAMRNGP